jgi:arginine/lysine/ornithine decarboxylase
MADKNNIVLIATPSNTREDLEALYTALSEIYDVLGVKNEKQTLLSPPSHNGTISPQLAFYSEPRMKPVSESIGEISAVTVTAYPPGIPILCAGEKITPSHVVYIRHLKNIGAVFTNFDGTRLAVI